MNLAQLSAFHAVMTSTSMTEAADRLGRTQPAISASIKSLEQQLNIKLFERRGRKLVPVPEAQYLLHEASAVLQKLQQVRQTMRGLGDGQIGTLSIAAMPGPVSMLFPRFIANHIRDLSEIRTSILARSSAQITELARAQNIDFGFADAPHAMDGDGLYRSEVLSGDCFVALPMGHPLGASDAIAIEVLDGLPMGSLQANHVHTQRLHAQFAQRGADLNLMVESQTFMPILQFIVAGQCCAILDPLTVVHVQETAELRDALLMRPLRDPVRYEYALISPTYRPISVTAKGARDAWKAEVHRLLDEIEADPVWEGPGEA